MKDKSRLKSVIIQTKINAESAARFDRIAREYGFKSRYELIQVILSTFIQKVDREVEGENEESMLLAEFGKIFENFENAKKSVISTRPGRVRELRLTDSINIYTEVGTKGYVCRNISYRANQVHSEGTIEHAIDVVLKKLLPVVHTQLREIMTEIDEDSIIKMIEDVVSNYKRGKGVSSTEYGVAPQRRWNRSVYDGER